MPCRPAISSHSLGRAWVHDIRPKLDAAAHYRFDIEVFYEDLLYLARSLPGGASADNQLKAASIIRSLCDERNISIVCLQPFMCYEGLRDREAHATRIEEMKLWIRLAKVLGTDIISIPSNTLSVAEISGDRSLIVQDLREVADLSARQNIKIAYESLAWGTYVDTWERAWEIVEQANRPNFGICLDTFNIAARVFADPSATSRKTSNAEDDMRLSIERLIKTVDIDKVFYVQVVDAEYLAEPLVEGHQFYKKDQPSRMSWSRNCRLFYGEEDRGAFLPIRKILKAVLVDVGFEGWLSAELFNASLAESNASVPEEHAHRAYESWKKIVKDLTPHPPSLDLKHRLIPAGQKEVDLRPQL